MARVFPKFSCLDAWPLPMLCRRSVRHWCGKAGVDDRRRDLIPVLRLAFGLYLQRRELDKGAGGDETAGLVARSSQAQRPRLLRRSWLIVRRRGPRAASCPAPSNLVLLPDPSLVRKPDLYPAAIDPLVARDRVQAIGEGFLKASTAPAAWA